VASRVGEATELACSSLPVRYILPQQSSGDCTLVGIKELNQLMNYDEVAKVAWDGKQILA
jgi:hypothetical protein